MNRLIISGEIVRIEPLRYSPAGVPIAEAAILHRSSQLIAQQPRQVECELTVQASGALAAELAGMAAGQQAGFEGALNRRSMNSRQLILILNRIERE